MRVVGLKGLFAFITRVFPLIEVHRVRMLAQIPHFSKTFVAVFTTEGFGSRVGAVMAFQSSFVSEKLGTILTFVTFDDSFAVARCHFVLFSDVVFTRTTIVLHYNLRGGIVSFPIKQFKSGSVGVVVIHKDEL